MTTDPTYEPCGSLAQLLSWRNDERPQFPLLHVEGEGPWEVGHIAAAASRLADQLAAAGVERGDRVLVRLGNDERFLAALTATWLVGGAAIAMHPTAPRSDTAAVVETMGARVIVADPGDAAAAGHTVDHISLAGVPRANTAAVHLAVPKIDSGDEALVLLTSGSTGAPKGVALAHANGWANLRATVSAFRRDTSFGPLPDAPRPPNLIANPLSHTAGVVRLLFALYVGRGVVLLRKFDATAAKAAIDRHGIDNLTINPTMLRMLLEQLPPGSDLGAVRYVSSGTAPLPPALREAFEERFAVPVMQAYGQTEAFGGVAIESVKDVLAGRRRPGSVGRPLPGVEVRIVADGRDAPVEGEGEIWVRTRSATTGYIGDGPASPVDDDGWLHTGDLGALDGDGYLSITGRLKNIIICGGFNVVPDEVEAALVADERIRDAAVVGLPDERLGEIPVAVVTVVDGVEDADDILTQLADRLAPYKRPRRLVIVPELPRVPNGKVDLRAAIALASDA
jgi:long-chain acyl-CoA synthetase